MPDAQKQTVFDYVRPLLADPTHFSWINMREYLRAHEIRGVNKGDLFRKADNHRCGPLCLVTEADAHAAGVLMGDCQTVDDLCRGNAPAPPRSSRPSRQAQSRRSQKADAAEAQAHRQLREDEQSRAFWAANWPQVEAEDDLKAIVAAALDRTSDDCLRRASCSFCGHDELVSVLQDRDVESLDVSLLVSSVEALRRESAQDRIEPYRLANGRFQACPTCWRCVRQNKFIKIPYLSYANGCWLGDVPSVLKGLTYLEELVIARARSTRCWIKINVGRGDPALAQRAASGNVCICTSGYIVVHDISSGS